MVSKYRRLTANDFIAQERINQIAISNWIPCTDERFQEVLSKDDLKFKYSRDLVNKLYQQELLSTGFSYRRVMALELNEYLERYLWPNYLAKTATRQETLSVCVMVNEKARERIPIWKAFIGSPDEFGGLINRVLHYLLEEEIPLENNLNNEADQRMCLEHTVMLIFLSHCFTNLAEVGVLRSALREVYSLATWRCLNKNRYENLIKTYPRMGKLLSKMTKYEVNKLTEEQRQQNDFSHQFLSKFIPKFLATLDHYIMSTIKPHSLIMQYLSRSLLWFIDLLSMLLTRRFLSTVFDDAGLVVRCEYAVERMHSPELSKNYPMKQLWLELSKMIKLYGLFQIDDITGDALDDSDLDKKQCDAIIDLQRALYILFKDENPKVIDYTTCSISQLEDPEKLKKCLTNLTYNQLHRLAERFAIVGKLEEEKIEDQEDAEPTNKKSRQDFSEDSREYEFLLRMLIYKFAKRQSHLEDLNEISLYPTEDIIWDESRVPMEFYSGDECLALPKLGLQFLTLHDYLLRNFNLFRLETAYEIRHDLEDSVKRLKPWAGEHGQAVFDGWSRMALPIQSFNMIEVTKPALGTKHPSRVRADVRVTLVGLRSDVRKEWEQLRRYDPVFLVTIRPSLSRGWKYNPDEPFCKQFGVAYVRGCEIEGQVDLEGKLIPDEERFGLIPGKTIDKKTYVQNSPTWRVKLDPCQYQADLNNRLNEEKLVDEAKECLMRAKREGRPKEQVQELEKRLLEVEEQARAAEDIYGTFNLLVRRKPKENNFKAVLETIRDLMNTRSVVPDWLLDLLMGYLDPAEAHYSRQLGKYEKEQNWYDTFLSTDHIKRIFTQYQIKFDGGDQIKPPFKITFPDLREDHTVKVEAMMDDEQKLKKESTEDVKKHLEILVQSVEKPIEPNYDLMPSSKREKHRIKKKPGNLVNFTKAQIEAIRSGMQFGLTLIVGPPGTGKTDVAVQIIQNLYHNYPNQRILIVTHSNQALNQLFEKIIALNVDERHLLRLGHGEEDLASSEDFSRYGRVDYILQRRIELLKEIMHLSKSLSKDEAQAAASAVHAPFEINPHILDKAVAVAHQDVIGKTSDAKETAVAVAEAVLKAKTTAIMNAEKDIKALTKKVNDDIQMYTCETAQYFFVQTVLPLWEDFMLSMSLIQKALAISKEETQKEENSAYMTEEKANEKLKNEFPFLLYFTGAREPTDPKVAKFFERATFAENLDVARSCFRHLASIFSKLDEFRAFELMRNGIERSNYLLTQEAKIIAMTCTHAALRRRDLVQLGFTYDTIIMEEAAQILEIETFIPLLLQNPDLNGKNRLRRWIMIGDHNQLPPVVKNQAFNNYSNMGQSLFARLVKLGVPAVQLDAQGRARPSLSKYYSWRYKQLLDLEHTKTNPEYKMCNPGFVFDSQIIDVGDYKGIGESEPSAYFYQNLAEAEYIVAVYMYMRILGYPPEKISILTTYNGQKHLIRDVLKKRCSDNPIFGLPSKVTTVDRFQGQQNDYILVSLVRTKTVGHLRDVRRLVVALSRARLGLYIFARIGQFMTCQELRPAFRLLLGFDQPKRFPNGKPTKLQLVPTESYQNLHGMEASTVSKDVRACDEPMPANKMVTIKDMVEMANFVTNLYNDQLKNLLAKLPKHVQEAIQGSNTHEQQPSVEFIQKEVRKPDKLEEMDEDEEEATFGDDGERIDENAATPPRVDTEQPPKFVDEEGNSSDEGNIDV